MLLNSSVQSLVAEKFVLLILFFLLSLLTFFGRSVSVGSGKTFLGEAGRGGGGGGGAVLNRLIEELRFCLDVPLILTDNLIETFHHHWREFTFQF